MCVGREHVSRILRGQIRPTIATLRKLATALRTDLDGADRFLDSLRGQDNDGNKSGGKSDGKSGSKSKSNRVSKHNGS